MKKLDLNTSNVTVNRYFEGDGWLGLRDLNTSNVTVNLEYYLTGKIVEGFKYI